MQLGSMAISENPQVEWLLAWKAVGSPVLRNLSSDPQSALTCAYPEADGADLAECRHRLPITADPCR
jgi:hypothetical protein